MRETCPWPSDSRSILFTITHEKTFPTRNRCDVTVMNMLKLDCNKLQGSKDAKKMLSNDTILYTDGLGAAFSVDDAVDRVGYGRFQMRLTFLAGLGWLADAFEIIILSLIGDLVACDWQMKRWQIAVLTSLVFGGIMIGSPVFGTIADIYGRKKSLATSMSLLFVFGAVSAASPSYTWMVIFRVCMGFSLGGVAQGLTLCSEYMPSNMRGKAGFYLCYFWSLGTIGVILLAWIIMDYLDSWRILLLVASLPALIAIISIKWFPESARYFLVSNRYERAKKLLEQMARMNGKDLPAGKLVHVSQCSTRGRIADLLGKDFRRSTLLFWYCWFALAFAYYGVALISPIIIKDGTLPIYNSIANTSHMSFYDDMQEFVPCVKFTQQNYIDLLWTSSAEFPGLVAFTFLIEHCNRKALLGWSCFVSGILIFLLLIQTQYHIIILIFLFGARAIIVAVFQLIFIMTSEAFPTTLRAIAMGSGSAFCRFGGLVVPYVAQVLVIENAVAAVSVLGGVVLLAGVAAAFLPLETRGRHMQESHCLKS